MLNLNNLRTLLLRVKALPGLQTVVLFTPEGQLVSYVSDPYTPKDQVRVVVGLASEIWQETKEDGIGMADCELGHLLVLPVEEIRKNTQSPELKEPLMLLAFNSLGSMSWNDLEQKARELIEHLKRPVAELHGKLATAPVSPMNSPQRPVR